MDTHYLGNRLEAVLASPWLSSFLILTGVFSLYLIHTRYNTPLRRVPGPFLAGVTRLWKVRTIFTSRMEQNFIQQHQKYGPIVRVGPNEVSIADSEALKTIYSAGSAFTKTRWYGTLSMGAAQGAYDIFSDPTRDGHAAKKRMLSKTYSAASVGQLEASVQGLTDQLQQRFGEFAKSGQPMNLSNWFLWYAFDVIGQVSFSHEFGFLAVGKDIDNTLKTIDDTLQGLIVVAELPELAPYKTSWYFKYLPLLGRINSNLNLVVGKAFSSYAEREGKPDSVHTDILNMLLAVQQENPGRFNPIDVQLTMCLNIFAGSDTTSIALRAIIYYVVVNPRCYDRLMDELNAATEAGTLPEKNTAAEAQKLPYLQACIKEAMRLHPSVGTQMQRLVPEGGVEVCGIYLPPKTLVGVNGWVMHRQKSIFGDDADEFRPERWLEGDVGVLERHYMSWGYGSYSCLGKNIAQMEIYKAIPQILRKYRLRLARPKDEAWQCESYTFVHPRNFEVLVESIEGPSK